MSKARKKVRRAKPRMPYDILLDVCKRAYRKHVLNDEGIGWEGLCEELAESLASAMGEENFNKWVDGLDKS